MKKILFLVLMCVSVQIFSLCPEDINKDGSVTILDIMRVVNLWGFDYDLFGTRTIKGKIVDSYSNEGLDGIFIEPEGTFLVGAVVDEYHLNENDSGVYSKTTNINRGVFEIKDAPIGQYTLSFSRNDQTLEVYPVQSYLINVVPGYGVQDMGVFKLTPEATLVGSVFGQITDASKGTGINGAKVWLENGRTTYTETKIRAGQFEFTNAPAGTYHLSAWASKHATKSVLINVTDRGRIEQNIALEFLDITEGMSVISGFVVDSSTGKIPNKAIDMYCYGITTDVNGNSLTLEYFASTKVSDGGFAFYDVNPGTETPIKYTIIAGGNTTGYQPGTLSNIYPQPNQITDNLELSVVGKVGTISGKVTLLGLGGVEGITMEIFGLDGYVTYTQLDGSYVFPNVPLLDKLHEGYLIHAVSGNYRPDDPSTGYRRVKLYDDAFDPQVNATGINFSFITKTIDSSKGYLKGIISDVYGNLIEGISVTFTDINGLPVSRSSGADGVYFISGLSPQTAQVKAEDVRDLLEREFSQQIKIVTVVENEIAEVNFTLSRLLTDVSGFVYEETNGTPGFQSESPADTVISNARVELLLNSNDHTNPVAISSGDGSFYFINVPVGVWKYRITSDSYKTKNQVFYNINKFNPATYNTFHIQLGN